MSLPDPDRFVLMPSPTSEPQPQRAPPRLLRRRLSLALFITVAAFLTLLLLHRIRNEVCGRSTFLAAAGFCPVLSNVHWDLFYHLGGNGPWIPKINGVDYSDALLPDDCSVDQAHMLSRHAERYPTKNAGARHFDLLERLQSPAVNVTGPLSFLTTWTYFTDPSDPAFDNLTTSGPYAGTIQSFNTGKILRQRYDHLVPRTGRTKLWSCSSERDVETAKMFADGFFGTQWTSDGSAELEVIPEDEDRGANTLTPGDTCSQYLGDEKYGHDYGYSKLAEWQNVFTEPIAKRLAKYATGMRFGPLDIYSMMEMCGFETLARGVSPWCNVFTHKEWLEFEYARDLLHFYRAGPGNSYAGAMGLLWLNATQNLMSNGSSKDVYFSFVHDGDIVPVLATLEIFNEELVPQKLPANHMKMDRRWRTSDVVPMGGRLIFERITCGKTFKSAATEHFVRLFINDGLVEVPRQRSVTKIKHALRLADFQDFLASQREHFGDFRTVCSLPDDAADGIRFLHQ
ncbi:uncharacterized protein Z518_01490 [Rhinocladiella mackenziei CBS 650.93]|uniref:Rhinocladiella mackenziei CBS 650.93 unplaced genomic scaffold supercont1.1, whole genome shotgun sequence n=1 Tax=Rhinocladiella mackenziei CBS 650.93 TaxID=1442369 RepID=A0A0D2HIA3_9EURO|nr:uncharacterized protein Z518_01490 [Rhinocladiella mackenziei CBS 650.93]KIX10408.1 hypothetical protein Z518_01490 [Rhinocladiella mackenziei CBS 650.93]